MMNQRQYFEFVRRQLLELREDRSRAIADSRPDRVEMIDKRIAHFEGEVDRLKREMRDLEKVRYPKRGE